MLKRERYTCKRRCWCSAESYRVANVVMFYKILFMFAFTQRADASFARIAFNFIPTTFYLLECGNSACVTSCANITFMLIIYMNMYV